jgi:hypothetical protein
MGNPLKLFLSNIFDIDLNDDFMNQFINQNELDIEKILLHPLLFINLLYCKLWSFCYGTLPTKKDFSNFVEDQKINININEALNVKLLERIINSFFSLKFGFMHNVDTQELVVFSEELFQKKTNPIFIQEFLVEKWFYRFNHTICTPIESNLFKTFIEIYKKNKADNYQFEHFIDFYNELHKLNEFDQEYMTAFEVFQYNLYSNHNFFIKIIDAPCIILDHQITDYTVLNHLILLYEKELNKTCIIFDLCNNKNLQDPYHYFKINKDMLYMIPKLFKTCLSFSDSLYPTIKSLSYKKHKAIHYFSGIIINEKDLNFVKDLSVYDTYDRIIVSNIQEKKIVNSNNCFIIPRYYTDLEQNPINFVHSRVIVGNNTYNEFKDILDTFFQKNNIQSTTPRKYDFKADFVIDFYRELDHTLYSVNGVIPIVNYNNSFIKNLLNAIYITDMPNALDNLLKLYQSPHVIKQFKENTKITQMIHNIDLYKFIWKDHINFVSPHNEYNLRNNILIYYNFITEYFYKNLEKILSIKTNGSSNIQVILLDNRANPLSVVSTMFTLSNLNKNYWGCKIYTSKSAFDYYKKYLGKYAEIIVLEELNKPIKFHIDIYNDILKSTKFWRDLNCEKCLIIQEDGIVFREGVERFLNYDYVGAPWADSPENMYLKNSVNPNMVGNGGLSIRNVSKMIEVTDKYIREKHLLFYKNLSYMPEDVYFCQCLVKENAVLPSLEDAAQFGNEQLCYMGAIGIHKMWVYHSNTVTEQYFNTLLE